MERMKFLFFIFCLFNCNALHIGIQVVEGSSHHHHYHRHHHHRHHHHHHRHRHIKLFVFGDSYADTGNTAIPTSESWKVPYGTTFPGEPTGRFSDGHLYTDYLASFLGIKSPIPYRWRKYAVGLQHYGMNFAFGGTGVFDTWVPYPNMTRQIDFFEQLIHEGVYDKSDLNSWVAHVSVVGNDYNYYFSKNGTAQGLPAFIKSVVNQIYINLKRIHGLGVPRLVITALQPLGCLPFKTVSSSYQQCNEVDNAAVNLHNLLLQQAVQKLNNETKDSPFGILNLYGAFMDVFKKNGTDSGSVKFENPLKPCCVGISSGYACGNVDKNGTKKYTVCENPKSKFFWDGAHPTQEGWLALYSFLKSSLGQLY